MNMTTEQITKNAENIGMLKGILAQARREGLKRVILRVPLKLLSIDERYQTPVRTKRNINYLVKNWDENKLLPLVVVPHDEEGLFAIVDGFGRYSAMMQMYKSIEMEVECLILLCAPKDINERLKFEAEQYAFQNVNVATMKPIHKHGANIILNNQAAIILDKMKEKYGFEYPDSTTGNRSAKQIGSYSEALSIAKSHGDRGLDFIFSVCEGAGFDRQTNGYCAHIMRGLRDMYVFYGDNLDSVKEFISKKFRGISPTLLISIANTKYPMLDKRTAVSMYFEDCVVDGLGLNRNRIVEGTKAVRLVQVA